MAHNISEVNGEAEIFYYGDKPWHGLGTPVDHVLTAEEAIKEAHLDWPVEKKEIFFEEEPGVYKGAREFATVRTDINHCLGIVGKNYKPIQNIEAFGFMDTLTMSKEAKYHTAGALFSGERVWILAKLPDQIVVLDEDAIDKYLLITNNHDGRGSLKVMFTPIRVVCMNTLNHAMRGAQTTVNIAHTGDIEKKVIEAQRVLGIAVNYFKDLEGIFKNFAARELAETDLKEYIENVVPGESTRSTNIRTRIEELCHTGAGSEYSCGTLWGAYNAIAEYVDHHRTNYQKKPDQYIETINFGSGVEIKTRAYEEAIKLVSN